MAFHPPRGLRTALLRGTPKVGLLVGSGSEQVVELAGAGGLDFVLLDGEHGDGIDLPVMMRLIRAADAFSMPAMVRVGSNDVSTIQQVLDFGAIGICVPHVRTAEDAALAVSYAKYSPVGVRAMSPTVRACGYAGGPEWAEYWRTANDETVVMVIVEDKIGMSNLDEISAVPGVDVVWIGTGDLSQDMELADTPGPHPQLADAVQAGRRACVKYGKASACPLGGSILTPAETRAAAFARGVSDGHSLFFFVDTIVVNTGLKELTSALNPAPAVTA